jgi:hypothetical protein
MKFKETRETVLFTFVFPFLRFYGRRILRTGLDIYAIFNFRLKKLLLDKYSDKKIVFINKLANVICMQLMHEHIHEDYKDFYEEESDIVQKEIPELLQSDDFKQLIGQYLQLRAFYYSVVFISPELKAQSDTYLEKARAYIENVPALSSKEFWRKRKKIRRILRKEKKDYIRKLRAFFKEEAYRGIPKVELSTEQVTYLVTVVTVLFFLTGFVYNKYFLGSYGIDVSRFFSIGDYLSTSVDKIYVTAIGASIAVLSYLEGIYEAYRNEIVNVHFDVETRRKPRGIYYAIILSLVASIEYFYFDFSGKYRMLSIFIFIILLTALHAIPIERFFKKSLSVYISGIIIIYFVAMMSGDIMDARYKIERLDIGELKKYHVVLDEGLSLDTSSCILLSGNSQYFFLYDKNANKTYIIPGGYVKYVEAVNNKKSMLETVKSLFNQHDSNPTIDTHKNGTPE